MKPITKIILSIVLCELTGFLAVPFTIAAIPTWYATLHKPFFSPPNWIFGPVWTILYALMGISLFLVWSRGVKNNDQRYAIIFFCIQLVLNFFWSVSFFGFHAPLLGLINILLLLACIILTMWKFFSLSKPAFILFIPYLLWVGFATALNTAIVLLN